MDNRKYKLFTFYRFVKIKKIEYVKYKIDQSLKGKYIRGSILIANEGINASISGRENDLYEILKFIKRLLKIKKIILKENETDFIPFNRMKVRLKKEIVSLGKGKINLSKIKNHIHPSKWDELVSDSEVKLLDVRNLYEIEIGKFKGSINPYTLTFRDFPKKIQELKIDKNQKIAMYCTGGIRCEKASAYLSDIGYKNLYQLEGGILNYLEYKKKTKSISNWKGECFVFDNRVSVSKDLSKGGYSQCYGCRGPITKKDMESEQYKKGVYCPNCFSLRTKEQIHNSLTRQNQIDQAIKNKTHNIYIKKHKSA